MAGARSVMIWVVDASPGAGAMNTSKQDESGRAKRLSGSVRHDERGHAVWQWATDTARNAINSTSALLRKLEVPGLSVQDDAPRSGAPPAGAGRSSMANNVKATPEERAQDKGRAHAYSSYNAKRADVPKPAGSGRATKLPVSGPARSSWWRRLLRRD